MCYAIRITNHGDHTLDKFDNRVFNNLVEVQRAIESLAAYHSMLNENVSITYYHLKMMESFHRSDDGSLAPSQMN